MSYFCSLTVSNNVAIHRSDCKLHACMVSEPKPMYSSIGFFLARSQNVRSYFSTTQHGGKCDSGDIRVEMDSGVNPVELI